jgi:hypothetical protein
MFGSIFWVNHFSGIRRLFACNFQNFFQERHGSFHAGYQGGFLFLSIFALFFILPPCISVAIGLFPEKYWKGIMVFIVVPVGTTPEPEDSGRATERLLCMVKWIYPLVG